MPIGLFVGMTITATGGPLALVALNAPASFGQAARSSGLVTIAAGLLFCAPLAVWLGYAERITSAGGLFAFVEAAAGRRVALAQAALWTFSYALYLTYTVGFIVADVLPAAFPRITVHRGAAEALLAIAIATVALLPLRAALCVLTGIAAGQLVVVAVVAAVGMTHGAASAASLVGHGRPLPVARGAGTVSLLYVCASLPLFLGAEVRGGSRGVRRGLVVGFAVAAAAVVVGSTLAGDIGSRFAGTAVPGVSFAESVGGRGLSVAVGVGVAASVAGVVIAEWLALTRLLHTLSRQPVRLVSVAIAVPMVAVNLGVLADPAALYDRLLAPSMVALWLAQLMVVVAYPRFVTRWRRLRPGDLALTGVAAAVMLFGLYIALSGSAGS